MLKKNQKSLSSFFSRLNSIEQFNNYPQLILFSIIAYETAKINFLILFKESNLDWNIKFLENSWLISQFFGATIAGLLSDRFVKFSWRKPVVLSGMLCSLITLVALLNDSINWITFLIFVMLNGISGCYIGAVRAFYIDQFGQKQNRFISFVKTIIVQCIPWIIIGQLLFHGIVSKQSLQIISILTMSLSLVINLFLVKDLRKPQFEATHVFDELKKIFKKYNHIEYILVILAFFILEISYQLMPYFGEYTLSESHSFLLIFILGVAIALGAIIALFVRFSTMSALKSGYFIGCVLFFSYAFVAKMTLANDQLSLVEFFQYSILGGFLWVITIREFLFKSKLVEDGFILGLIESIQALAEFIGAWLISKKLFKSGINYKFFFILLLVAFLIVSLNSFMKWLKNRVK